MLNNVSLVGRLATDPELRYPPNKGAAVGTFNLAVERNYKNSKGERETDFIKIEIWGAQAKSCYEHLNKGRLVAVKGEMQTDMYKDEENGVTRYPAKVRARNVRFLDWPEDEQENNQQG